MSTHTTITVNAEPKPFQPGMTLRALIVHMGLEKNAVAAEVNGTLVSHRNHDTHVLQPGDKVELVSLVGGG